MLDIRALLPLVSLFKKALGYSAIPCYFSARKPTYILPHFAMWNLSMPDAPLPIGTLGRPSRSGGIPVKKLLCNRLD